MGIYNFKEMDVFNEIYFGQTEGITELFECFSAFRQKYVTDRKIFMGNINADHDELLNKFCRLVEKEWNIDSFSMLVQNNDVPNMCTLMPFFRVKDPKKCLIANKTGFKFKKECKIVLIVIAPTGLLFNSSFSDREMFSIFLHEVGHNFQEMINGKMLALNQITDTTLALQLGIELATNPIQGIKDLTTVSLLSNSILNKLSKLFTKMNEPAKKTIYTYINFVNGIIKNTTTFIKSPIFSILKPILLPINVIRNLPQVLFNPANSIHSYYAENMADRFASYYGFGSDLSTALLKFDNVNMKTSSEYIMNKIPLFSHLINTLSVPGQILQEISDCHPGAGTRVKNIYKSLEDDLKDPRIPESVKKEIKQELNKLDSSVDSFFKTTNNIKNPFIVKNLFNRFIYATCGGGLKYAFSAKFMDYNKEVNDVYYKYESEDLIDNVIIK